ncbi:MAG TPA: prepilin-type N-terminal cleavage/methylation domain-containing protein [Nocardioidaceae bacterium]|nr:prepilin-type N-terminal cleavage/methylation domain-containing protein [Nocardioidaceae bacterium]
MSVVHPRSEQSRRNEAGFTLIELLVVIIIIGILAAIAIPVFFAQRIKAYDSAAKSDLKNLAQFEEGYLVGQSRYATIADVVAAGDGVRVSGRVTLSVVLYSGASGYCLSAQHTSSPNVWFYDSLAGGIQPKGSPGCPTVTSGTSGDTLSG